MRAAYRHGARSGGSASAFWSRRAGRETGSDCRERSARCCAGRFEAADTERTHLLHVASLGYHEVYVNGRKVSDRVLAPAVSELGKRALSVTYDITSLLAEGRNEVVVWLGPGWYRRDTFRDASTDGPFVNVRLDEIAPEGPRTLLVSDTSWQGGESGYTPTPSATWRPLAFGGECVDGSRVPADLTPKTLDGRTWRPVATARLSGLKISPQMCEQNVVRDRSAASPTAYGSPTWAASSTAGSNCA